MGEVFAAPVSRTVKIVRLPDIVLLQRTRLYGRVNREAKYERRDTILKESFLYDGDD
jgi:hypothetical protein